MMSAAAAFRSPLRRRLFRFAISLCLLAGAGVPIAYPGHERSS